MEWIAMIRSSEKGRHEVANFLFLEIVVCTLNQKAAMEWIAMIRTSKKSRHEVIKISL